jgi:hypothetical protein
LWVAKDGVLLNVTDALVAAGQAKRPALPAQGAV